MTQNVADNPSPAPAGETYWRSVRQWAGDPALAEAAAKEFTGYDPKNLLTMSRRRFLALAGASMALAGMTLSGCRRWPQEQILPYASRPAGATPGAFERYASMLERGGVAHPLLVTTVDGRPIKVDGNPVHPLTGEPAYARALQQRIAGQPMSAVETEGLTQEQVDLLQTESVNVLQARLDAQFGRSDTYAQASVLDLYDPDRSRVPMRRQPPGATEPNPAASGPPIENQLLPTDWVAFEQFAASHFGLGGGSGAGQAGRVAILAESTSSPTVRRLQRSMGQAFPSSTWYAYEPIHRDNELQGLLEAAGRELRPVHDFAAADVVVCFDADPLGDHPAQVPNSTGWAKTRASIDDPTPSMSRVYVVEPSFTNTGSVADERIAAAPGRIAQMVQHLADGLQIAPNRYGRGQTPAIVEQMTRDLLAHRGSSIVTAGPNQPAWVHALVHDINASLGNVGNTVRYIAEPLAEDLPASRGIAELTEAMAAGNVDTLVILGGNPVQNAPAGLAFADALSQVTTSIHLAHHVDETSQRCTWHLPRAHALESWGDGRAWDGSVLIQQPMIRPLWNGRSIIELVAMLAGQAAPGLELVRQTMREDGRLLGQADDFEVAWRQAVHDGFIDGSALEGVDAPPSNNRSRQPEAPAGDGTFALVLRPHPGVYDGRFANNGWLQELPAPMTKVTWGNPLLLSPGDAANLGVDYGDTVSIAAGDRELTLPVYVMPGQADGVAVAYAGQGRTAAGRIGGRMTDDGEGHTVGVDLYTLRETADAAPLAVRIVAAGGEEELATTTEHHLLGSEHHVEWALEERVGEPMGSCKLIKSTTFDRFTSDDHHFASYGTHGDMALQLYDPPAVWPDGEYHQPNPDGPEYFNYSHAWGMAIDLSRCTGCNACVVACQAENNIPIVGKDQVLMSREMHWLRIDTYYRGSPELDEHGKGPEPVHMPLFCVHCENAPCEQVCPVAATVHDTEGLNTMVYNRCIGTRYCSNNCPYKVRRFNYFDWHARPFDAHRNPWLSMPDTEQVNKVDPVARMQFNPEVTVRMRGVMEKCTYCTQRISQVKIDSRNQWQRAQRGEHGFDRPEGTVTDAEVTTACQAACPTDCIVFGDLNDPDSRVSRLQQHNVRSYKLLEELNTRPRTRHMGLVRNPVHSPEASGH